MPHKTVTPAHATQHLYRSGQRSDRKVRVNDERPFSAKLFAAPLLSKSSILFAKPKSAKFPFSLREYLMLTEALEKDMSERQVEYLN